MSHADKLAAALRLALPYVWIDESDPDVQKDRDVRTAIEEALAEHEAYTFAKACHELADRARNVYESNPGLRIGEMAGLLQLEFHGHAIGDNAECAPDLFIEAAR